ncbi:diaminopimelate epimerase [Novosphingobium taihuense]|uniref:Diaminopimelate epimerase n=1 Tax=Novosphingobium taihuense TaxID=260085 RepID=A0A7W7ADR0_9SPHN|nr:diaminopimelate epimerase [Novosphingobium taihuense]MBB4615118.1 diaminopimelate epimerase [Novosphingobium taihuense]TWH84154.1 diaminopimelate epimerase [Novosphingobium taihuense]
MRIPFRKMHGLGNDFVVIDAREAPVPMTTRRAAALADRRTGIGCDQLIVLEPSDVADVRMRIFNNDGSEVEACGNASRAVGLLLGGTQSIETLGGLIRSEAGADGVSVDMGSPRFDWQEIPLSYAMDTLELPVGWEELENPVGVNVGNPHAVFFVPDADAVELERLGPIIENDPVFPERVNVNVASLVGPDHLKLRVWERGAGLTRACGTGACATAVAAMRRKLTGRKVRVDLPGGPLTIAWPEGGTIEMTGPAALSFEGSFEDADFPA